MRRQSSSIVPGEFIQPVASSYHSWPRYESRGGGRLLRNLPGPMGFRGGRFGYGPMRMPRGAPRFMYGRIMKRGFVQRRPFEFKKLPEAAKYKEYAVAPDNIICFSGFQNVFTAQHDFPLEIDGRVYDNVNHFYQLAKTEALCGVTSLLMTECAEVDGSSKSTPKDYNTLARNILKINKVSRSAAEEWRKGPGLEAMQRALLAKVEQCEELRKELMESGDKLLVHCFGGDDFYASACSHNYIQDWAKSMQNNKVMIKIPMEFPLTNETVLSIPKFGLGRNVLGVIYMQLREMLRDGVLPYKGKTSKISSENQSMEMQSEELAGPSIVPSVPAPLKNDPRENNSSDGFIIGGGSIQSSMKSRSAASTTSRNVLSVPLEYLASFSSK
ncbi:unnamed protein product [Cercopithifilaria johnstoni]|uniref:NADAR domain-containing protein n=1 Tax=Cercopithifilaria johnstoni TaxID=2874296 RepID=A0A8J2LY40_9BILA|nr:unnamed protein product [Cercopithifilaria johnstoni]